MINHDELLEMLHYNPNTGIFTWAKKRQKIKAGSVAGSLHKSGYMHIEVKQKGYAAHRLAWFYMTGEWPKEQIDHINRNKSDNRFGNLREATNSQNRSNTEKTNKHGLKGVCHKKWLKQKPWQAQITHHKKVIYLGCYSTPEEAHQAYKDAAIKLHGVFANP